MVFCEIRLQTTTEVSLRSSLNEFAEAGGDPSWPSKVRAFFILDERTVRLNS